MSDKSTIKAKMDKLNLKSKDYLQRLNIFKDTATDALDDAGKFDSTIIASNEEYIIKLQEGDKEELEILKLNMEKAETEEEREAIRLRMKEMREEKYKKDTENKEFYENQQDSHRKHVMKILGAVAVTAGLVKFRKPIMDVGKKMLTKKII